MAERAATCSCGQIGVTCKGEPELVSICHCDACKKRTGSMFGVAVFFDSSAIDSKGNPATYSRNSENGHEVRFKFCPTCGTSIYWFASRMPGKTAIAAGCFDDPFAFAPDQEVFTEKRCPWLGAFDFRGSGSSPENK